VGCQSTVDGKLQTHNSAEGSAMERDKDFSGGIPELYERTLVPLIFEPYAVDLAKRVIPAKPKSVLEIAAGTGAVTRELASHLPLDCAITATDLNQPMLDVGQRRGTSRPVTWKRADALQLPFDDECFDVVVCQFGAMFFPDRVQGYREVRRVLKPGGLFIFNVWDRLEDNEFTHVVQETLGRIFPDDPPRFMSRTPHGYYEANVIQRDLRAAHFADDARFETVTKISRAESTRVVANALCQGTPLRNEIEARDASKLQEASQAAEQALVAQFGHGAIEGKIQAIVVSVTR
ncbi:MAG TPA: class I SAM-dependent methyltransferase, partial [Steroidobacteraceae bacterium]|nr:class I SAM-dependent methyltransferase [Steroidobacteraceae bacterium]